VEVSPTSPSYISQVDCNEYLFPNGDLHPTCLLENESGLCLDASSANVTAESCQANDLQEWWWAKSDGLPSGYWFINAYWSDESGLSYMTASGSGSGSVIKVEGSGHGDFAEWVYG
jgi:hypothetical protein